MKRIARRMAAFVAVGLFGIGFLAGPASAGVPCEDGGGAVSAQAGPGYVIVNCADGSIEIYIH